MKISLINPPYFSRFSRQQRSPAVIKSGTLYYPYWLSFATGILEKEAFEVSLLDAVAMELDVKQSIKRIKDFEADLVIVETSTPSIDNDIDFCRELKETLNYAVVVLVGTHPSAMYDEILNNNAHIDIIAIGEYDYTVLDIAKNVLMKKDFKTIDGIAFREGEKIVRTSNRDYIHNLDELPFVSRVYNQYLDIDKYYFSLSSHPMIMLITGRGCSNKCSFCVYPQTLHGRKYRCRSPENVVEELDYITKEIPRVKEIVFEDDTFSADQERIVKICKLIMKRGIETKWFANLRVDTEFETLKIMKDAGFRCCAVGFESGSQQILDSINKGITLEQSLRFKKFCDQLGILVHGCFMVGFPDESKQTMIETLEFAKKLDCDSAQFYPVFLYPGTEAYAWAKRNNFLKTTDFKRWLNSRGYHDCVFDLANLSADEMINFCEGAYKKYHFSMNYILRKLKQSLLNATESRRNLRAAYNFIKYSIM